MPAACLHARFPDRGTSETADNPGTGSRGALPEISRWGLPQARASRAFPDRKPSRVSTGWPREPHPLPRNRRTGSDAKARPSPLRYLLAELEHERRGVPCKLADGFAQVFEGGLVMEQGVAVSTPIDLSLR